MAEIVDQLRKLEQRLENKLAGRHRRVSRHRRIPIGPLAPNSNTAASRLAQDQRLGPADTPGFKDLETLALERVERVSNLRPSQRLVDNLGSSR